MYLRARHYDPVIGRFTTEDTHWNTGNMIHGDEPVTWNEREPDKNDPLGLKSHTCKPDILAIMQSGNRYAFGINNPIAYKDPSGHVAIALPVVGAGVVVVGAAYLLARSIYGVAKAIANAVSKAQTAKMLEEKAKDKSVNPPLHGKPNTSADIKDKNGKVTGKRYYGPDGRAIMDVDLSDHGNPKTHPKVPHEHKWDWLNPKNPIRR